MNSEERLLLYISYSFPELVKEQYKLANALKGSDIYFYLTQNIKKCSEYENARSKKLVSYYEGLNFNVSSMEEYVMLYSRIYFLCTQTHERYYINPLAIKEGQCSLKSLGEILFKFDGSLVPFNTIVDRNGYSLAYKKLAVKENVGIYKSEMYELIDDKIKLIKDRKMTRRRLNLGNMLSIIETIFILVFVALFIFALCLSKLRDFIFAAPFTNIPSIMTFIYFIAMIIYISLYIIVATWHNRLYEPVFYTRRFMLIHKRAIYSLIDKKCLQLEKYLNNALETRRHLRKDIYMFAGYNESVIDLSSLNILQKGIDNRGYNFFSAVKNISFGIMILVALAYGCYLIFLAFTQGSLF